MAYHAYHKKTKKTRIIKLLTSHNIEIGRSLFLMTGGLFQPPKTLYIYTTQKWWSRPLKLGFILSLQQIIG